MIYAVMFHVDIFSSIYLAHLIILNSSKIKRIVILFQKVILLFLWKLSWKPAFLKMSIYNF